MAKKTFKSISDAQKYLMFEIKKVTREIIIDEIIPTMLEKIDEVVYDNYTPQGTNPYTRRYEHGGLADPSNIDYEMDINGMKLSVCIRNNAEVSGKKTSTKGYDYQLDWLLIDGESNWYNSQWYKERHGRDFYKETMEVMKYELPILLQNKFKERGIKVNFKTTQR